MFEVWKLKLKIRRERRLFAPHREKLELRKAPPEEFEQLDIEEFEVVREIEKEIDIIEGGRLFRNARHLDVETPPLSDKEMWQDEYGGRRIWFTPKGRAHVRKLIDEEESRRFEAKSRWVTKIILPLLTLSLGIIGTITGLVAVNLNRKQMEGVKAAIVEMSHGVSVDFPVPPSGEVRANFTNSGYVIAHGVHLSLSLILKNNEPSVNERKILSKNETISAIVPTSVATRPDLIYPFQLSPEEHKRVMESDAYLIAEGSFAYENGFGTRVEEPFCYAYVWGSNKFGRWTGACEDVRSQLSSAKKMAPSPTPAPDAAAPKKQFPE
jgi:hypothetical protein